MGDYSDWQNPEGGYGDSQQPGVLYADKGTVTPKPTGGQTVSSTPPNPRITIVDYRKALSDEQLKIVVKEVKEALDNATRQAQDLSLKEKGVEVTSQRDLQRVENLRKKGGILVYIVHNTKDATNRDKVIRDILNAEGTFKDKQKRLNDLVPEIAAQLDPTQPDAKHLLHRASNVAFINVDLISGRKPENLRAIAGDVIHEGIGHRAIEAPKGQDTYHNPQDKGVMSKNIRQTATKEDVLFQSDEVGKVNKFLKSTVDNPGWNKD
jgi:hypothetical protein